MIRLTMGFKGILILLLIAVGLLGLRWHVLVPGSRGNLSAHSKCQSNSSKSHCLSSELMPVNSLSVNSHPYAATTSLAVPPAEVTEVIGCHLRDGNIYCMSGTTKYIVHASAASVNEVPMSYGTCHAHGAATYCTAPGGADVQIELAASAEFPEQHLLGESKSGKHCHSHAGVEHCVGGSDETERHCQRIDRDYNIPTRVIFLVLVLVASAVGVYGPILVSTYSPQATGSLLVFLRQFGTGVVISTAFVHLFTHSILMFGNECLGDIGYEATPSAIMIFGMFVSFLVEYIGNELLEVVTTETSAVWDKTQSNTSGTSAEMLNVMILEAGIVFHSFLIGLTLVVTADGFFVTLAIVILLHQMFEGVALGSRIAALGTSDSGVVPDPHHSGHGHIHSQVHTGHFYSYERLSPAQRVQPAGHVSVTKKLVLATGFTLVTPLGMLVGIGVLRRFNGNDPLTILAIGTLDAFSAGILVWFGVVEMWAHDWLLGDEMSRTTKLNKALGMMGLLGGMFSMSYLGKWA